MLGRCRCSSRPECSAEPAHRRDADRGGELRVDAERGPNKARFITRASIQARIDCCAGPSTAG